MQVKEQPTNWPNRKRKTEKENKYSKKYVSDAKIKDQPNSWINVQQKQRSAMIARKIDEFRI